MCLKYHITNVTYQEYEERIFYYVTYPGVREKLYAISVNGDMLSLVKNREKKLKPDIDKRGYLSFRLRTESGSKHDNVKIPLARLVAWEFVGQPEDFRELEANHCDGNHEHNYYKNIEWVTPHENGVHKALYGLAAQSEGHGWNKHKEEVVRDVIVLIQRGKSAPEIAVFILQKYPKLYSSKTKQDYDRLRNLVSKIKNGTSWYNLVNELKGSTTIESITYEKHIGEEASRVGLKPIPARKGGHVIFVNRK